MKGRMAASIMATMMVLLTASPAFAADDDRRRRGQPINPELTPCFFSTQAAEHAPRCAAGA